MDKRQNITSVDTEIDAMATIATALDKFKEDGHDVIERILTWTLNRYKMDNIKVQAENRILGRVQNPGNTSIFQHESELYNAFGPKFAAEKALVVAYWYQVITEHADFTAQEVNASLKHLGQGVSNITDALGSLMKKKPALAMQVKKTGKSKQSRKKYRLTIEGINRVNEQINAV